MNPDIALIEQRLRRAKRRWYCLELARRSCIVFLGWTVLVLLWGALIVCGWVKGKELALILFASAGGIGLVAWLAVLGNLLARPPSRGWFGQALERVNCQLQDRVNALVFLQSKTPEGPRAASLIERISAQARRVLRETTAPSPFSARNTLGWVAAVLMASGTLLLLNQRFAPLNRLAHQPAMAVAQGGTADSFGEAVFTNHIEAKPAWGEVRILEPGTDLQVTKTDTVPLAIEAAANEDLSSVSWACAVNGGQESQHELPTPVDPRYASYRPALRLDQMNLSDWDVVTYYAKAQTAASNSYSSEIYFLEIRPSAEDRLKWPGGAGGQADQTLKDFSSLIGRQQQVIRQTHQHVHNPPAQEQAREVDRQKLAGSEDELGAAARDLPAELKAKMANQPVSGTLDNLAKAQNALVDAGGLLRKDDMAEAQQTERAALADLLAACKVFQKAVSDHPGALTQQNNGEQSPMTDDLAKKHQAPARPQGETKSAQGFVRPQLAGAPQTTETPAARAKAEAAELLKMDPQRLPPAYRARIQTYFQKLSENSAR